tara:strand:+ start:8636 stop:9160 length:525 start_codon:yes stop_codon:yes gene_type:complete
MTCTPNCSVTLLTDPSRLDVYDLSRRRGHLTFVVFEFKVKVRWWCDGYCPADGIELKSCPKGQQIDTVISVNVDDLDISNKEITKLGDLGWRDSDSYTQEEWQWVKDFAKDNAEELDSKMRESAETFKPKVIAELLARDYCKCDEDEGRRLKFTFMLNDYLNGRDFKSKRAFSL